MHPSSNGGGVLQPDELYSLLRDQGAPDSPPYSPRPSGSISPPSPASRDEEDIDVDDIDKPEPEAGASAASSDKDSSSRSQNDSQNDSNVIPDARRYRTSFSREQITRLEKEFVRESYINKQRRQELARELRLSEGTIKVWFQNRRMKDKRQKLSFGFSYADPAIASYFLHAASGYQPYLSPNTLPWLAPPMLSIGGPPVAPIPYAPMDLMNVHNSYVTRYSPYFKPRVSYPPEVHQAPRPPVPPHAVPVPGISPPTSALKVHLSGCPTPHVPANLCSCVYMYSPYGAPAIPHPLPVSAYPVHAPPMACQMNSSQPFVLPAGHIKSEMNAQLSPSPPSQQGSPLSNLAASETKPTTTSPKLFKPYDEEPARDTE